MALSTGAATATRSLTAGLVKQGNDGYRAQEWSSREQAWMAGRWRGKGGETLALITLQRASWALPGSVDSLTAYTDPRTARPYSQLVNAHVDKTQLLAGLFNELALGHGLKLRNGIHAQVIDKENPYGTSAANNGYKDERIGAFGARLALHGEHRMRRYDLAWDAGLEALAEQDELLEHTFPGGVMGDVRTDASTRVGHLTPFAALQLRDGRFTMHAALGGERYEVRHDDHLRDTVQRTTRSAGLLPTVGLAYAVNDQLRVHARHGNATSRPTVWELLGSTGVFNPDLAGERVTEWELGLDLGADSGAVRASAVGYARTIDGLIEAVAIDGTDQVTYRNTGTARQNGLELSATGTARSAGGTLVSGVVALALQDHRWYRDGADGPVTAPGVPDLTFGLLGRVGLRQGTTLEAGWRSVAPVSADAAATAEVPGYALVHLRATQRFRLRAGGALGLFLHVDNLFDERYTGFVQVNEPGGRYYNPAPGRSLFVGAAFTWRERTGP
jgi:iron complex outermembrane receptor protein